MADYASGWGLLPPIDDDGRWAQMMQKAQDAYDQQKMRQGDYIINPSRPYLNINPPPQPIPNAMGGPIDMPSPLGGGRRKRAPSINDSNENPDINRDTYQGWGGMPYWMRSWGNRT